MRRVSILMPCRDAARYLEAAITSIREQTLEDYEVVAVDDGSTDATFDLLHRWAREDPRVRVLSTGGRGLVAALASGLAAARGELVARMDADDVAEPDRLEKQVALMDGDPRIAACGTGVEYFPTEQVRAGARRYQAWVNSLVTHQEIARDIFVECPLPHPSLLIRRHVLLGIGGYRELGWPEDYDLVLRLWAAGYRMGKVPEVLLHWRESPERASRTDDRYADVEFRRIKIYFLRHTLLAGDRAAIVWGAGPIGKTFARELAAAGTRIAAFVDIDPNKIGQEIHGAPVMAPDGVGALLRASAPSAGAADPTGAESGAGPTSGAPASGASAGAAPTSGAETGAAPTSGDPDGSGTAGAPGPRRPQPFAGMPPSPRSPLILAAVGQAGAREEIRAECRRQGLVEIDDFVAVA